MRRSTEKNRTGTDIEPSYSRLEATLVTTNVALRPMSRQANDVWRHARPADLNVDELDFNYAIAIDEYPITHLQSPQELLAAVQYHEHLSKAENFAYSTSIECLSIESHNGGELAGLLLKM